jgi:multimeric flavodoxin WrbA
MAETPELEPYTFDASAYDRIVFGFPVWAGIVTPPLRTFIKENDLS